MFRVLRTKAVTVPVALLLLGLLIGSFNNKAQHKGRSSLATGATQAIILPFDLIFHYSFKYFNSLLLSMRTHKALLSENAVLRERVRVLSEENARLREAWEDNISLRKHLSLRSTLSYRTIAAEVVSREQSQWFDTFTVNRGRNAGLNKGDAIINHMGLVGQVIEADAWSAKVVALTDPDSAVGAVVQRSRVQGIVKGQGSEYLVLSYLAKDSDVKESDIVVTSGIAGVVPRGLRVGRVVNVIRDQVAGTTEAIVRPSVRADQVGHVLVVKPSQ